MGIYGKLMELNTVKKEPEKLAVSPRRLPVEKSSVEASNKEKNLVPPSLPVSTQSEFVGEGAPKQSSDTTIPRYHDTTTPSMVSRYHDTTIEFIRVAVKAFGKEAATHRFTPEEKKAIADIIYTYKIQGVKTSENEVARIAINFIVSDYKENGENSILYKAIKALKE